MNTIFKKVYNEIKKYNVIYIARHIGADPDAVGSQMALKRSIEISFGGKKVYAVGTKIARFKYFGEIDKVDTYDYENGLLICVDVPDKRRVDIPSMEKFKNVVKIDHHPFVETFGEVEYIDSHKSSAAELIYELICATKLKINKEIAEDLFLGIISDSNRLMFEPCSYKEFYLVGDLIKNNKLNIQELYAKLYSKPISELRLMGYIASNLKITKNGFAFIDIENDIIKSFNADAASASNMINDFNNIEGINVWMFISRDEKNNIYRINIRSKGPFVNEVASKYGGGGHKNASGVRTNDKEAIESLKEELDNLCMEYNRSKE